MIKKLISPLVPVPIKKSIKNYRILSKEYGQYESMKRWESIDGNGEPIPWYSYPAVEYIKQLDFSDKIIFEYGSGYSTRFWAKRCKKLVSVEDNHEWHSKIKPMLPGNVEYHLRQEKKEFVSSIKQYSHDFDIILIDGSHRYDCAVEALNKLRADGFVILDNSDWREKTSELLREADLIEVDMSGFCAINGYTTTTSFYFTRKVKLKPAFDRQPVPGIGSLTHREK